MAARVSDLEGLPYWPRMLSRAQAASYVGVSPGQFAKEVEEGRWPEATGRPYQKFHFGHEFARIRALAQLPAELQFRDLRRTAATELGAAGATDDEIRAVTDPGGDRAPVARGGRCICSAR